jgi:hypothetical protein
MKSFLILRQIEIVGNAMNESIILIKKKVNE